MQIQQQESSNQTVCVYNENLAVKCPSCEFRCSIIEELEIHLKNESHYHPCNHLDCKEYFRSKNKLQNHLAIAHGGSQVNLWKITFLVKLCRWIFASDFFFGQNFVFRKIFLHNVHLFSISFVACADSVKKGLWEVQLW